MPPLESQLERLRSRSWETTKYLKILCVVWLLDSVLLVWLFIYVWLNGNTPENSQWAGDLGGIWGVTSAFLLVPTWKAFKRSFTSLYRTFIYSIVCFTSIAASGVFLLVWAAAPGSPKAFTRDSVSLVGLIFTAIWASRSWSAITLVEPESNPEFHQKHRTFGLKAGVIILSVLLIAAFAGGYIGIRASHVAKLEMVLNEVRELGKKAAPQKQLFVKLAREKRDAQTLAEYTQRCSELEPALKDYVASEVQMDNLFSQSQQEIEELKPNANYTSSLPALGVLRAVFAKDIEGAKFFGKEIEYAKQLPNIPETNRTQYYKANIQPAIEEEGKIARDEIEILKDAKARNINLPVSMYKEYGIE